MHLQFRFRSRNACAVSSVRLLAIGNHAQSGGHTHLPRMAAEWEPALGALITWPLRIPRQLAVEIAKDDVLFVVVKKWSQKKAARVLQSWGISRDSIRFIVAPTGATRQWTRDWGPNAVFSIDGKMNLVNHEFFGYPIMGREQYGPFKYLSLGSSHKENLAPKFIAENLSLPYEELPIILTGGNALVDGYGTVFSTWALVNENLQKLGISSEHFFKIAKDHLGLYRQFILPNFEKSGIQHIDIFLKLLDEERILVRQTPRDHPEYEKTESIVDMLKTLKTPYGRRYEIFRIYTPPYKKGVLAAYTNSLILNRKIFVPLFGLKADRDAVETWKRVMPGYEVHGYEHPGRITVGWSYTDALHCRVRAIWNPGMLYLRHKRVQKTISQARAYPIEVTAKDYSRHNVNPVSVQVRWRVEGTLKWQTETLRASAERDQYTGSIASPGPGKSVEYFVEAEAGHKEFLPRTAPSGFYTFKILRIDTS